MSRLQQVMLSLKLNLNETGRAPPLTKHLTPETLEKRDAFMILKHYAKRSNNQTRIKWYQTLYQNYHINQQEEQDLIKIDNATLTVAKTPESYIKKANSEQLLMLAYNQNLNDSDVELLIARAAWYGGQTTIIRALLKNQKLATPQLGKLIDSPYLSIRKLVVQTNSANPEQLRRMYKKSRSDTLRAMITQKLEDIC